MKEKFLKLAGVKNEKEFYKLFPTEDAFMAKYGKQVKKLNLGDTLGKLAGSNAFAAGVQSLGDVVGGIQQMKDEKDKLAIAEQMKGVSDVSLQASMLKPESVQRKYVDPSKTVNTGEAFFPVFGVGTTLAKNGGEIANTFAPNTIYTDLEQAFDGFKLPKINTNPDFMKQATGKNAKPGDVSDIYDFAQQGGGSMLTSLTAGIGSPAGYGTSGAGKIGKGIGSAAGSIFLGPVGGMIGGAVGQFADLIDRKAEKTQDFNEATMANIDKMTLGQGAQSLQRQNYAYMRTGGNLRQNQMAMGGNLQTHWGGGAELMSYNPYLPEGGETIMFKGQSHDESDGKGNTGIGITYGDNPVEVERGEPAVQLRDGSDGNSNLTVYGNLKIPKFGAQMIGDTKASGKKFKNYVAELSKTEQRQNTIMDKSTKALDGLDVNNSFDKLSFGSYQAMMTGADMKLKDIATKKKNAADLQSAINDTADQYGLVADDLAKGKIKQAKMGAKINKAQTGETISPENYKAAMDFYNQGKIKEFQQMGMKLFPKFVESLGTPTISKRFDDDIKGSRTEKLKDYMTQLSQRSTQPTQPTLESIAAGIPGRSIEDIQSQIGSDMNALQSIYTEKADEAPNVEAKGKFDWMTMANQILPYLRPSNAEQLDPRQLSGEMYALSTNQLQPVDAQLFQPQLSTPYDISLQDQLNANQSDYRAAQRMMGYNPAAQAMLNAQKYQANQQVLGEQFRMNQAMRDKVYGENRQLLDQAKLQNLGILDQQYGRQQQALSNTKATTQAALNSISSKYAQNQLENRTLQTYENMYNYRFDPRMRAINMNPLAQYSTEMQGPSSPEMQELFREYERKNPERFKKGSDYRKNGGLVRAIKNTSLLNLKKQ
jgi:hypothetical protein